MAGQAIAAAGVVTKARPVAIGRGQKDIVTAIVGHHRLGVGAQPLPAPATRLTTATTTTNADVVQFHRIVVAIRTTFPYDYALAIGHARISALRPQHGSQTTA